MFTGFSRYVLLFFILTGISIHSNAQDRKKVDSLLNVVRHGADSSMVDAKVELASEYMHSDKYDSAAAYGKDALAGAERLGLKKRMISAHNILGLISKARGDIAQAIPEYTIALKLAEEIDDKNVQALLLSNIGNIYGSLDQNTQAIPFHLRALEIRKQLKDSSGISKVYNNIGLNYERLGQLEKALEYYFQSMSIKKRLKEPLPLANSYSNISNVFRKEKLFDDAIRYEKMSLALREEADSKKGICISTFNLGLVYLDLKKYPETEAYFIRSLGLARSLQSVEDIKQACAGLAELYERTGHPEKAYDYMKEYSQLRDSIFKDEFARAITEMNAKYETEKKDKELLKKDVKISEQNAAAREQALIRNIIIACLGVVMVLALFIFRGYRNKQKANRIISEQKKEVEMQKEIVEMKQKEILDSIHYASRIQQSLLTPESYIERTLHRLKNLKD